MRLQARITVTMAAVALAAGAAIITFARQSVTGILMASAAEPGLLALEAAAPRAEAGLRANSESALLPLLTELVGRLDASYGMVLDSDGSIVAHSDVLQRGRRPTRAALLSAAASQGSGHLAAVGGDAPVLEVFTPVWASDEDFLLAQESGGRVRLGTLVVGLSAARAAEVRARIVSRVALILAVAGLAAGALIAVSMRRILRPIRLLAESVARIGKGERGVRVSHVSKDELGELAESFNRMSRDLVATTVSKEYLDGLVSAIPDIVIEAGVDGVIRRANPAARALGRTEAELVDRPLDVLLPEAVAPWVREVLAGGVVENREVGLIGAGGEPVPVLLSGSPIMDRGGRRSGIVLVAKDLRERKRLEAMLLQSEKLSSVGQLAAGVAHEINNPLGIILGFAQSAARRTAPGDAAALPLRSIEREALRCKRLVESLLAFSRQGRARAERLDLGEVVAETLGIVEAQARMRAVELRRELSPTPGFVGDRNQLQQVALNLCNNALDAMASGGRLTVRTRVEDGCGVLEVEDDGTGIPETVRARIFDPFFTTKEVGKGTGLGLALVHEIVQRHGGRIDLDTEVGKGTRFTVSIPMAGPRGGAA